MPRNEHFLPRYNGNHSESMYMYFVLAANLPRAFQTPAANLPQALLTPVDVTAINVSLGKAVTTVVVNTRAKFAASVKKVSRWLAVSFPPV